jgi:hypothetical protein
VRIYGCSDILAAQNLLAAEKIGKPQSISRGTWNTEIGENALGCFADVGEIEKSYGNIATVKQANEDKRIELHPCGIYRAGRTAFRILIYFYQLGVQKQIAVYFVHIGYIRAHHKRRAAKAPKGKLSIILGLSATVILSYVAASEHTHGQHIKIVEASGRISVELLHLAQHDPLHGFPAIIYIAARAEHMSTYSAHPACGFFHTPVAGREKNVPAA